jgi:membrane-associated protease RseP (regulator of RpoE activity)
MKKVFWLSCMAMMMLFPFTNSSWGADDDPLGNAIVAEEKNPPDQLPEYWLGVQFQPAFPALMAQLHLPEHEGMVVMAVVPDSPAAKAGLSRYDVIIKADDKKLSDVSDLLKAVDAAKDKEMKLEIIREGQAKSITITPAKRPAEFGPRTPPSETAIEAFRKWIEQLPPGAGFDQQGPMQFRFMRPGVILPRGAPVHPPLPGNMSITITKTGDKPADIVVKEGDEKWEVGEKDLDKLPEKVRPYVEGMLGLAASTGAGAMRWIPEVTPSSPPEPGATMNMPPGNNREGRIERRLDEMMRHIEKLENELQMRHPDARPPEPPPPPEKNKADAPQGKTAL